MQFYFLNNFLFTIHFRPSRYRINKNIVGINQKKKKIEKEKNT